MVITEDLTEAQWVQYEDEGYVRLGMVVEQAELVALQERIDAIMLGRADVPYEKLMMQLDSKDGQYESAGVQSRGWKGETLDYRKIQELEHDPLFLAYMQKPLFHAICRRVYGEGTSIASFRAMFMNKPANRGTLLPWHQDRWNYLDRDPLITVWTALDPATRANGCVQIISGSHRYGLINPDHPSGFLNEAQATHYASTHDIAFLELEAGEAVLLHNWLLHRSDTNATSIPRRAFSVCYMDGHTRTKSGESYFPLF